VSRIGLLIPYLSGHINPMLALGQALRERGHDIIFFSQIDLEATITGAGLRFIPYGEQTFPAGSVRAAMARIGRLPGQASFRVFLEEMAQLATTAFSELPPLIEAEALDLLLIDQLFPGGATVADHLQLPFVSVACALIVNRDDSVPPPVLPWPYDPFENGLARNRQGWAEFGADFEPLLEFVNDQRAAWKLAPYGDFLEDSFSPLLQIAQQPPGLEFPRQQRPANLHLLGPFRQEDTSAESGFPWARLDGRPLIYASLGTLQNGLEWVYRAILNAVAALDVQAVVTLGRGAMSGPGGLAAGGVPENVILVPYAPQISLLRRAVLCITHAGLNTTTDCLTSGVPMVAIPIASEQPGIAARVAWTGAGMALSLDTLSAESLRAAVVEVLGDTVYRRQAQMHAAEIARLQPLAEACSLIEEVLAQPSNGLRL
jgi:MGT family glycosyltransferase